jgi:hypothetical protein
LNFQFWLFGCDGTGEGSETAHLIRDCGLKGCALTSQMHQKKTLTRYNAPFSC